MAQRVGKYKLTKREQETSLTDGGTINGTVNVTGDAQITNINPVSGSTGSVPNQFE